MKNKGGGFGRGLTQYAKTKSNQMKQIGRELTIYWFTSTVLGTPVLSGRARGNWQLTTGSPAAGTTDSTDASGAAAVSTFKAEIENMDQVYYLSNNLPYIRRLEYEGWSAQAPIGMVRVSLTKARKYFRVLIRRYNK